MNENDDFNMNDDGLDDLISSIENETSSSSMDNISADMSKETEEEIAQKISDLKSETRKRKEKSMNNDKKERKNLKYNKYIVARIFLAIQTGGTSELAFWLGRKSTEDGIQKHIDSSSSD